MSARRGWPVVLGVLAGVGLSACAGADLEADATPPPREIDLTMSDDMTFEPSRVRVERGESVVFRIRNVAAEGHEAYIGTDDAQRLHENDHFNARAGEQPEIDHHSYGIHIAPFGFGELAFKFDVGSDYLIGCHYPGHYAAGMRAVIEIDE